MARLTLRFFFDPGAGGCLWPADDATRAALGAGPADAGIATADGRPLQAPALRLSPETTALRDHLDAELALSLNPVYPPDPGLFTQRRCDRFNADIDRLLALLLRDLAQDATIRDEQPRLAEDPRLAGWLRDHPDHAALD